MSIITPKRKVLRMSVQDRKSGSAGMPRPSSYAVFCLKKKKFGEDRARLFADLGITLGTEDDEHIDGHRMGQRRLANKGLRPVRLPVQVVLSSSLWRAGKVRWQSRPR